MVAPSGDSDLQTKSWASTAILWVSTEVQYPWGPPKKTFPGNMSNRGICWWNNLNILPIFSYYGLISHFLLGRMSHFFGCQSPILSHYDTISHVYPCSRNLDTTEKSQADSTGSCPRIPRTQPFSLPVAAAFPDLQRAERLTAIAMLRYRHWCLKVLRWIYMGTVPNRESD